MVVMRILQMHKDWKEKKKRRKDGHQACLSISVHVQQVNVKYELGCSFYFIAGCFLGSYLVHLQLT